MSGAPGGRLPFVRHEQEGAGDARRTEERVIRAKPSNSLRGYHVDTITAAKSADTRQRRIDKAIALFRAGKQR
jgi:hypothetical protein